MTFEFGWNKEKKVEVLNRGTQQTYLTSATPKQIIATPYGFREQDIIHSLCIVLTELVEMEEARCQSQVNQMNLNLSKGNGNGSNEEKENDEKSQASDEESDEQREDHSENETVNP